MARRNRSLLKWVAAALTLALLSFGVAALTRAAEEDKAT